MTTIELFFVAVVAVALAIAFGLLNRSRRGAIATEKVSDHEFEEGVVSEPVPVVAAVPRTPLIEGNAMVSVVMASDTGVCWASQFEPRPGRLNDAARLRLIDDLGMLRAEWCAQLLEQACEEETDPANRTAARAALARCRGEGRSGR